jgi:hypothetical protein
MCIVNDIKVDEVTLRQVMPELNTIAAIRLWVQKLVDTHIQQLRALPDCDMTPEELYNAISDEIDYIYAKG